MCLTISLSEDRFWGRRPEDWPFLFLMCLTIPSGTGPSHLSCSRMATVRVGFLSLIGLSIRVPGHRPAVDLVSGEEGLSLSRPLRPPFHCDVPGGLYLLWYGVTGTRFPEVRPHRLPVLFKRTWSLRGSRGHAPMGADGGVCRLLYAVYQMLSSVLSGCCLAIAWFLYGCCRAGVWLLCVVKNR